MPHLNHDFDRGGFQCHSCGYRSNLLVLCPVCEQLELQQQIVDLNSQRHGPPPRSSSGGEALGGIVGIIFLCFICGWAYDIVTEWWNTRDWMLTLYWVLGVIGAVLLACVVIGILIELTNDKK